MTKLRDPLTYENAISKIASFLGWAHCAEIAGVGEKALRNWGDQEIAAGIRLDRAELLDLAFQQAGGEGTPLFDCYRLRIEAGTIEVRACTVELARMTAMAIKEGGEAHAAQVNATIPGAGEAERLIAIRETEEAIAAHTSVLAQLSAGLSHNGSPK